MDFAMCAFIITEYIPRRRVKIQAHPTLGLRKAAIPKALFNSTFPAGAKTSSPSFE